MVRAVSGFGLPYAAYGCAQVKISGYGVIPYCIILVNPIRKVEGGKEIQEGKARRPGAREEGMKKAKPAKRAKAKKRPQKFVPAPMVPSEPTATLGGLTE
jgi:hypothetical protein